MTPRLAVRCIFLSTTLFNVPPVFSQAGLPTAANASTTTNDASHEAHWRRQIAADLVAERFDDLDRMAAEYRLNKSRRAGGEWKLQAFYGTLDQPRLSDEDTVAHLEHLRKWMKLRPESITARVALATSLHRWAWVARGNGYANTVSPAQAALFHQRNDEAAFVLETSRDMPHMCPQWYSQMLAFGLADGFDAARMKEAFDRAVQYEPTYDPYYKIYADYLLPKWHGNFGDSAQFAKDSANRLSGTTGDILYFQIASVLVSRGDGDFRASQLDWDRIQAGYHAVVTQFGGSRKIENQLAFMAYKFKDHALARQLFASIGDDWSQSVWKDRPFFDRTRDWASGHTVWP